MTWPVWLNIHIVFYLILWRKCSDLIMLWWIFALLSIFAFYVLWWHDLRYIWIKHILLPGTHVIFWDLINWREGLRTWDFRASWFKFLYVLQNLFKYLWLHSPLFSLTAWRASFSFSALRFDLRLDQVYFLFKLLVLFLNDNFWVLNFWRVSFNWFLSFFLSRWKRQHLI
jgi:hypothetical protein